MPQASCHVTLAKGTVASVPYESCVVPQHLAVFERNEAAAAGAGVPHSTPSEFLLPKDRQGPCNSVSEAKADLGDRSTRGDHRCQNVSMQSKSFVEAEKREIGSVKFETYKGYVMVAGGLWAVAVVLLMPVGYMGSILDRVSTCDPAVHSPSCPVRNLTVNSHGGSVSGLVPIPTQNRETPTSIFPEAAYPTHLRHITTQCQLAGTCSQSHSLYYYVGVYLALPLGICVLFVVKFFSVLACSIRASRTLFKDFSTAILNAPLNG